LNSHYFHHLKCYKQLSTLNSPFSVRKEPLKLTLPCEKRHANPFSHFLNYLPLFLPFLVLGILRILTAGSTDCELKKASLASLHPVSDFNVVQLRASNQKHKCYFSCFFPSFFCFYLNPCHRHFIFCRFSLFSATFSLYVSSLTKNVFIYLHIHEFQQ
jgi:hypothetical protein